MSLEGSGQEAVTVLDAIDRDESVVPSVTVGVDTVEGVGVAILEATISDIVLGVTVRSTRADSLAISRDNSPGNLITPRSGSHGDVVNGTIEGSSNLEIVSLIGSGGETGTVGIVVNGHVTSMPSIAVGVVTVDRIGSISKTTGLLVGLVVGVRSS